MMCGHARQHFLASQSHYVALYCHDRVLEILEESAVPLLWRFGNLPASLPADTFGISTLLSQSRNPKVSWEECHSKSIHTLNISSPYCH